jgi:cytochrome c peroxidase
MKKVIILIIATVNFAYSTNDESLRKLALDSGYKPIPQSLEKIKELFDNPNNPITIEKIKLGKKLFNDKNLSLSRKISCATCHDIKDGGEDGKPTAIGHKNRANPFHLNTPTVLNSAFAKSFFWDGRSPTLADQAKGPTQASFEMASTPQLIEQRVKENKFYQQKFKEIFNSDSAITFDNITKVIATYEKTLLTYGDFDKFLEGNNNAINKKAKKGLELFANIGCKGCHSGYAFGGLLTAKFPLRTYNGLIMPKFIYDKRKKLEDMTIQLTTKSNRYPFENKGGFLGKNSLQIFRVPILRNITKTAPYFHNGMVKDLDKAIYIMGKYQVGIDLNETQISQIKEFLKTLEGEVISPIK